MRIYHWRSEALADDPGADGDIFVAAESVEEARAKATGHADSYFATDQCDAYNLIASDVAEKPYAIGDDDGVLFIQGPS